MQINATDTAERRFAYWLRRLREEREPRLSQVALAEMVGLDPTALTKIEKGTRSIRLNEAHALAEALSLPVSSMLRAPRPTAWQALVVAEE